MPPFEYKVLKMSHNRQEFYSDLLMSFGWQVQGISENVDKVETRSFGTTLTTGTGRQNATFWHHPRTYNTTMSGDSTNRGWSSQMGNEVTTMKTSLSVTYQRDLGLPNRDRLAQFENQCLTCANRYLARLDSGGGQGYENWADWQSYSYFKRKGQNLMRAGTEALSQATARFSGLAGSHDAAGITFVITVSIQNRKDLHCMMTVYMENSDGTPLASSDGTYERGGKVAVSVFLKPTYDDCIWRDLNLFIPSSEVHVPKGKATIRYYAALYDISTDTEIARTSCREFSYSRSLFGKIQTTELSSGPIETIGNLPKPKQRVPATPAPGTPAAAPELAMPETPATPAKPAASVCPKANTSAPAKKAVRSSSKPAASASGSPELKPAHAVEPPVIVKRSKKELAKTPAANGSFDDVRAVFDAVSERKPGIEIAVDFRLSGRNGTPCMVWIEFKTNSGSRLADHDQQYNTETGEVATSRAFTPGFDSARYDDFRLFIPYEQLDLPDGEYDLYFTVFVKDPLWNNRVLVRSGQTWFHYSQHSGSCIGTFTKSAYRPVKSVKVKKSGATKKPAEKRQASDAHSRTRVDGTTE